MSMKETLDLTSDYEKLLIFGWIHLNYKQFCPIHLIYLCLQYFWNHEFFKFCTQDLQLSMKKKKISSVLPYYKGEFDEKLKYINIGVGNIRINSINKVIAKWKFKIGGDDLCDDFMAIGIISRTFRDGLTQLEGPTWWNYNDFIVRPYYKILSNGLAFRHNHKHYPTEVLLKNTIYSFKRGDKIEIILNTKSHTLSMKVNKLSERIITNNVYINEEIQYAIAVSFFNLNLSLTLINFDLQQM